MWWLVKIWKSKLNVPANQALEPSGRSETTNAPLAMRER